MQTAEIVAARLGVGVTACKSLREVYIGDADRPAVRRTAGIDDGLRRSGTPGRSDARFEDGESGAEVVERHRAQFEEIADLHRGETVLVVGHQTALGIVVPTLAGNVTHRLGAGQRAGQHRVASSSRTTPTAGSCAAGAP